VTTATVDAPLDLRDVWRRVRLPVILGVLLLATATVIAILRNAPPQRPLDPTDASPVGSRALAELLRDRGVTVVPAEEAPGAAAAGTVFVPDPASLSRSALQALATSTASLVVVAPDLRELDALGVRAHPVQSVEETLRARCVVPAASVAGPVDYTGPLYAGPATADGCYAFGDGVGLFSDRRAGATTTVFGSAETFTNRSLDEEGDAALGLGLLGEGPTLTWVLPKPPTSGAGDGTHKGLLELLPERLLWALLMLVVAVIATALWRARRLGPVVVEPLPVVVRATETVEGRARLLRAARARDAASATLRDATAARLRDLLGLASDAGPAVLVAATAARTGRPGSEVEQVLFGGVPRDDAALVRLAKDLIRLEESVRRT
jgi:hypothetical protein